jgi:hypothetical protein
MVKAPLFPFSGLYYGNPAARPNVYYPYNVAPYGPYGPGLPGTYGYGTAAVPGILGTGQTATARSADLTNPNVTGHPTRFFSYSQYFFTQGGGVAATTATGTVPAAPPARATPVIGTAPPRGRANTKTGS